MPAYSRDDLKLFTAEENGEVSDRPMRSVIDANIRDFHQAIDEEQWDTAKIYLSEDAKLVERLDRPGSIYNGANSVIQYYKDSRDAHERTVIKALVVDRGRAFCGLESFWIETHDKSEAATKAASEFRRMRKVCIFDVDAKYLVKRIEFRDTDQEIITIGGGLKEMRDAVRESKKDVVVMEENFGF
ncbi:hypothetical protein CSIM01_08494 [Colletotrichum simmondsii]|uniref:SnoaL-like domain-containing protein n=1 Tax=Colletotrichum simmondsii TaxID=703756 RepID=A0A135SXZ5_9PEZI|nr:hypothetical protein CSIM01_08494 [Colletotrichum simmondsii]